MEIYQILKELIVDLTEKKEHIENNQEFGEDIEDFHSGFQEGYAYGIEHAIEKLNEILEDERNKND